MWKWSGNCAMLLKFIKRLGRANRRGSHRTAEDGAGGCNDKWGLGGGVGLWFADLTCRDTHWFSRRRCLWTNSLQPGEKFPIPPILSPFSITSAQISTLFPAHKHWPTACSRLLITASSLLTFVIFYPISASFMQHSSPHNNKKVHTCIYLSCLSRIRAFLEASNNLPGRELSSAPLILPFPLIYLRVS